MAEDIDATVKKHQEVRTCEEKSKLVKQTAETVNQWMKMISLVI